MQFLEKELQHVPTYSTQKLEFIDWTSGNMVPAFYWIIFLGS